MSAYTFPRAARCCAVTDSGDYCRRPPNRSLLVRLGLPLPPFIQLCRQHLYAAQDEHERERIRAAQEAKSRKAEAMRNSDVYYVQREDGLIKIGFSSSLGPRLGSLRRAHGPLILLATHKGGRPAEGAQHHRFREQRVVGEWFRPTPELLSHINQINARRSAWPPSTGTED